LFSGCLANRCRGSYYTCQMFNAGVPQRLGQSSRSTDGLLRRLWIVGATLRRIDGAKKDRLMPAFMV
jgi:hypothetical protein